MLVFVRFTAPPADFDVQAQAALGVLAARPGFVSGRVGRATDDPQAWVLVLEWVGVGAWRRALSSFPVKSEVSPLLALGHDEPSAFEVLATTDGGPVEVAISDRASERTTDRASDRMLETRWEEADGGR